MTPEEIKAALPDACKFYYNGLTQEEAFNCGVANWVGQFMGVWYMGTEVEVPEFADRQIA